MNETGWNILTEEESRMLELAGLEAARKEEVSKNLNGLKTSLRNIADRLEWVESLSPEEREKELQNLKK